MKIMILTAYYERPNMVRNALHSLLMQDFQNWELVFVDDSSKQPGEPVVREVLASCIDKVRFYNTNDDLKLIRGSIFAKFWNDAILDSDSGISIMLCDDDALYPNYLGRLSNWFECHQNQKYCYGHVVPFDPFDVKTLSDIPTNTKFWLNQTGRINPYHVVDASQVAWRNEAFRMSGVRFPYPQTKGLDASLYQQLFKLYGECNYNGLIAQYKAIFPDQLGRRAEVYAVRDIGFKPK